MKGTSRLIVVWWAACRYRLDLLLPQATPLLIKLLFLPAKLFSKKNQTDGYRLRFFFEEMGPIFIKFGQLLSTRPDMLSEEIATELANLQDNVTAFDPAEFKRIVEHGLGAPVTELFAEFEEQPMASASLAQVHGAVLLDGRSVVIKVIRPKVERRIEADIALLKTVAKLVNRMGADGRRLHAPQVVRDYESTIHNELNLQHEAGNTQKLRDNFLDNPINYTPEVYWPYVRSNILVLERIDGIPVTDIEALRAQGTDIQKLAERGVEIFFTQVFDHNFFHADMHPGNIFVSKQNPSDPQYISVDCAIVGSLTEEERYYLGSMLLAVFKRDYRRVAEAQIMAGWVSAETRISEFEGEIRAVCEPIFSKPLSEISFAEMLVSLFRTARRFDMQVMPSLVLLEKTIINIEGLGRQLYPELDLWATAQPYLENWARQRYCPKTLIEKLSQQAPDWLEQLPEVPPMLFNLLKRLQEEPEVDSAPATRPKSSRAFGGLMIGSAIGLLGASYLSIPLLPVATGLLAVAGIWLVIRG